MTIMVGMSGGVDSSVSAYLLQQQGHEIAGLFMKNWEDDERFGACQAEEDADDARLVARKLGIALHERNFAAEYWDRVFTHFLDEYKAGRTPNPDILCNREIKFSTFLEHAQVLGAECIATGHYVRRRQRDDQWQLLRGIDTGKDQSYFLYTLGQSQIAATHFPVGEIEKPQVREIAEKIGLHVHNKKDSTGVCFIGARDFKGFLSAYIPAQPGDMITEDNTVIGKHDGLMYYTLGQRQGLGIGGVAGGSGEPWYVVDKDLANNRLIVGQGHHHPALYSQSLRASELSFVAGSAPKSTFRCTAKTRYRQADEACTVTIQGNSMQVAFDAPQRAVTPGQSVVLYDQEVCLGGGIIDTTDAPTLYAKESR